jgi:uncharacterized protein YlxP (DUF503 family)
MTIGTCMIELHIPGNGSLKGKRRVIKSTSTEEYKIVWSESFCCWRKEARNPR